VSDTERMASALERIAAAIEAFTSSGAGVASSSPPPPPAAQAFAAQAPKPAQGAPTVCPVHNVEFRTTKRDGSPAKRAFCSKTDEDGNYCNEKGAWL
jgi:hypothetical protein